MLPISSCFVLLCLWFNSIQPGLAKLKLGQEHVCRKFTHSAYEKLLDNCPGVEEDVNGFLRCRANLEKEWKTMVCCEGYVKVGSECKRKFKNQM